MRRRLPTPAPATREHERVTWSGKHRATIRNLGVYPRPAQQPLPVWIAVGGTPQSVVRAATLGLPMALAIIGGAPERFVPLIELYRESARRAGHDPIPPIGINSHVRIADDSRRAADEFFPSYAELMTRIGRERGWPPTTRAQYEALRSARGALLVGSPQEVIDKMLFEHELFGNARGNAGLMHRLHNHHRRIPMRHLVVVTVLGLTMSAAAGAQGKGKFRLTSSEVHQGQRIAAAQVFNGMGCTGSNISPALSWSGAPAGTKSYALTVYDPDAPTGSGWWHWVVYNIPASATSLPSGAGDASKNLLPAGASQGNTDFGTPGYGGPCPPAGDKPHHYIFSVYALNTERLDIPSNATAAYVGFNIHGHQLGKATLMALYAR